MRVLDICCGEGGASQGYANAGCIVVGVDNDPKAISRYPFSAFLGDWETGLAYWLKRTEIDFIHASPPCQRYSRTARLHPEIEYPDLIPPIREALKATGLPYVIENVPEAPLIDPVILCGSMFQLHGWWKEAYVALDRHRGFEASFPVIPPLDCTCQDFITVPVFGHGAPGNKTDRAQFFKGKGFAQLTKDVMGIDWMSRDGLTEAIPPKYTEYIAYQFQAHTGNMANVHARTARQRGVDVYDHVA